MHNPDHASGTDLGAMASSNDGPSDAELVALGQDGGLLSTIFGGALVDDEEPFLDRLVALHNSGQIDLLALPLEELSQLDTHDYFDGHSRLYRIIPRLQGETLPMMRLVNALVARAGEDLASNMPNAAYRDWAEVDPVRPKEGVALAMQSDADAIRVLRFNLEAGGFVDLALELTASSDPERRLPAIVALGKIAVGDNQERSALKAFKASLDAFPDDATAANILSTTLELGRRSSALNDPAVLDVLDAALSLAGPMTHYVAASKLSDAPMPEAVVSRLLDVLADTDRSHHRTIQFLDTGLASLLGGPHEELAETMMRRLLTDPERALQVSALRSSGRRLLDRPADRLSKTISRWLLSDEHRLRQALDKFLSAADRKEAMDFTVTGENLMPLDQLLLCRRACGYFFVKPMLAASILVGVLRDGAPQVRRQVAELLYDPLAINYGGMARDYLAAIDPRDPAHPFVATVLTRLEARNAALEAAGFLDELAPSASRRQMEATALELSESVAALDRLVAEELPHCTLQSWIPDSASEEALYVGVDDHGFAITGLPATGPDLLRRLAEATRIETAGDGLSAMITGNWPVVLLACRHHGLPVPPQFWIHQLIPPAPSNPGSPPDDLGNGT